MSSDLAENTRQVAALKTDCVERTNDPDTPANIAGYFTVTL